MWKRFHEGNLQEAYIEGDVKISRAFIYATVRAHESQQKREKLIILKELFCAIPFVRPWFEQPGGASTEAATTEGETLELTGRALRNANGKKREKEYNRRSRHAQALIKKLPIEYDLDDGSQLPVVFPVNKAKEVVPPAERLTEEAKREKVRKRLTALKAKAGKKQRK